MSTGSKDNLGHYYVDGDLNSGLPDLQKLHADAKRIAEETFKDCDGDIYRVTDHCAPGYHGLECPFEADDQPGPCIAHEAQKAERLLRNLKRLYAFKVCARQPKNAQGWCTMEGCALRSCLYKQEYAQAIIASIALLT